LDPARDALATNRPFFFHEGQVTAADKDGVSIMDLLRIDLSAEQQHIEGTHGEGVKSDARVAAEAAFESGDITQTQLDAIPEVIPAPGRELSWAELGRVFEQHGTNWEDQLGYQPGLFGYIIKGTAEASSRNGQDVLVPARLGTDLDAVTTTAADPNAGWIEWLIEPRENVLQGQVTKVGDKFFMAGVELLESTLPGMPVMTTADLDLAADLGQTGTIVGHWMPQVPTGTGAFMGHEYTTNGDAPTEVQMAPAFYCREWEPDPGTEGTNLAGDVILSYEGPITAEPTATKEINGASYAVIEIMNREVLVPFEMEVPGISPQGTAELFTGADIALLANRNDADQKTYVPTIGATFAGLARWNGENIIMDSIKFIELAENVAGSYVTWTETTPEFQGAFGGSMTPQNDIPDGAKARARFAENDSNVTKLTQPGDVSPGAQQILSDDPFFTGDFMDVGGEPIVIKDAPTGTFTEDGTRILSKDHPSARRLLLVGFYGHPELNPNGTHPNANVGDGEFHFIEGLTEYHPAGTVRIARAGGRQTGTGPSGEVRLDIIGQVKPALRNGNDDSAEDIGANGTQPTAGDYHPVPTEVIVDLGNLGTYRVPTIVAFGAVNGEPLAGGGFINGNNAGGVGPIGQWRLTLRAGGDDTPQDVAGSVSDGVTVTLPQMGAENTGWTVPAEITVSVVDTSIDEHTVPMDTRFDEAGAP
jgi:hypothetical protein